MTKNRRSVGGERRRERGDWFVTVLKYQNSFIASRRKDDGKSRLVQRLVVREEEKTGTGTEQDDWGGQEGPIDYEHSATRYSEH